MVTSGSLLDTISQSNDSQSNFKMATVSSVSGTSAYLTFYGESVASQKTYKRLSSYTPAAGDTVVCANINGSYVILGKVV